jgi:hypothetical protein
MIWSVSTFGASSAAAFASTVVNGCITPLLPSAGARR